MKSARKRPPGPRTLAVDIGGTGIKVMALDARGRALTERTRLDTPDPATPSAVLSTILALAVGHGAYDRVSVGFPGVVVRGVVKTAPNLGTGRWAGFDLEKAMTQHTRRPTRICNDADMQGFGAIAGRGVELVLTLGTGIGAGLFVDGRLVPNLELGHHPFRSGKTYEEALGQAALKRIGKKKWRSRMQRAVASLEPVFNYRRLYLGGGNSRLLESCDLPDSVELVSNIAGLLGGIALWDESKYPRTART